MDIQSAIRCVIERRDLEGAQMTSVMQSIMTGECTPAQVGGFLVGLRMKGETVEEIAAAAAVMRRLATHVEVDRSYLIDTCGTGGDTSGTFNISTASALVAGRRGGQGREAWQSLGVRSIGERRTCWRRRESDSTSIRHESRGASMRRGWGSCSRRLITVR